MRLQLIRWTTALGLAGALWGVAGAARAQVVTFDTAHTFYHEAPTRTNMTVYSPNTALKASPWSWLDVSGGYEADIVSGASVATKAGSAYQATNPGADVISTASVKDVRHRGFGGLGLKKDDVAFTGGFSYSTENDYKSRTLNLALRTDAFDHNSQFEISYARSFDLVCDRVQSSTDGFARFRALEDSKGCFTDVPERRTRDLVVDGFQGSWSQSWTPELVTQAVYSAQVLNGFQSNPYRSIIVGQGIKGQEHHPENRARHALALRGNYYVRPIKTVFRLGLRGYLDSWDVKSVTTEVEAERYLGERLRLALRGRFYKQGGAVFWSDDYTGGDLPLGPKGQYFTGDRELSPFYSFLVGLRLGYAVEAQKNRILGILHNVKVGGSFDVVHFNYEQYTLGGAPVGNARAFIGALNASLGF